MDWITGIQKAIDYIEENMMEELNYTEIAKQAYSSSFHFQRIFSILCGCTIGEYIRSRRMTLAGSELASSDIKIVDIALKFGYDTPESFSRAFTRFHGIKPSQAKEYGAMLKSYSRLSVKMIIEGGSVMNYRIDKKDAFQMIVKKQYFPEQEAMKERKLEEKISSFWQEATKDGTIDTLCHYIKKGNIFGDAIVGISFSSSKDDTDFPYGIGVAYENGEVADGFIVEEIPASTWAIFECVGAMPEAFKNLWNQVYTEFFPTSEYQPYGGHFFEVYPSTDVLSSDYKCEFWISVQKK